ncbi:hypothetical protein HBH70_003200 [Parastagonospora nodorum]|nr:hypothetical protein HBH51_035080 [Parastagonospora nodorum]KAH4005283.1 hypothetical protein HBI10_035610 [Parastagonospora nodorum]KAH4032905.1 hypothetical protein HBI13_003560 [Parastagonospora nodorum]KAH4072682.1 hypothetical protein HBH50_062790 [Parastagonospora nodorum]KAH4099169.1 hypothetical protein HBH48_003570 [Parastagonospora nodorum]
MYAALGIDQPHQAPPHAYAAPPHHAPPQAASSTTVPQHWPAAPHSHYTGQYPARYISENVLPTIAPRHDAQGMESKKRNYPEAADIDRYHRWAQERAQTHQSTGPREAAREVEMPQVYVPSTGSFALLDRPIPIPYTTSSHTPGAPSLPGAALYEKTKLAKSDRTPEPSRKHEGTTNKRSSSPPPLLQNHKVRRLEHPQARQESRQSYTVAKQPVGMSEPPRGTQHNPLEIPSSPERAPQHVASQKKKKQKYYAVAVGHEMGIYTEWDKVKLQTDGYPGAKHKAFATRAEAVDWFRENQRPINQESRKQADYLDRAEWHYVQQGHSGLYGHPASGPGRPPYDAEALRIYRQEINIMEQKRHAELGIEPPLELDEELELPYAVFNAASPHKATEISLDPDPVLKPEQQKVVDLILEGHNVFYTGSAGCGKSTILKAFVKQMSLRGKRVKIVAPTNLAALNVGGVTTWSFAGWTPDSMKKSLATLMKNASGKEVWERFDKTDVLVIDEISMVENLLFERLNHIMKASIGEKRGGGPFGGVQVIVTGDFCQLSPVRPFQYCIGCGWELIRDNQWRPKEYRCENKHCGEDVFQDIDKWAFRSKAWEECNFKHINLTEIHRQSDKKFISILQKIRTDGVILKPHGHILLNHTSETEGAIKLFARRDDVDRVNNENISQLPAEPVTYKCVDHFDWKPHHKDDTSMEKNARPGEDGTLAALKEHRYEIYVHLKEGMRVVLQANLDASAGLVNGSQGTIIGFEPFDEKRLPRKPENRNEAGASDANFTRGTYARYFEEQIKFFAKQNKSQPWPIVKFDNGLERTIFADATASELGNEEPYSLLSRTQIPLMAGYAITVHKSQGMTLERVIVDLSRAFEPSQIYVALSRARSLKGLKVIGLPRTNLGGANEQVKEFFEKFLKKTST